MFLTKTKTQKKESRNDNFVDVRKQVLGYFFEIFIFANGKNLKKLFPERRIHINFLLGCSLSIYPREYSFERLLPYFKNSCF